MSDIPAYFNFATDVMDDWARRQPEALALWWIAEDSTQEKKLTFAGIAADSRRAANFFRDCGIQPGDPVLVMLPRMLMPVRPVQPENT